MLYAGLDLSRQRLDVHVLDEDGRTVEVTAVRPDGRRAPHARRPHRAARPGGDGGRRVDDGSPLRPRPARARRLGRRDRRRGQGQGAGAARGQDRQDRRPGARRAGPTRPRAGDLAARPGGPRGAGAGPLPPPPRPPSDRPQEPHPRHAHHLRSPGAGGGPLRCGRPGAARAARACPEPWARRWRRACGWSTNSTTGSAPATGSCGGSVPTTRRPAPHDRARGGLGPGLHDRVGDRRHPPFRQPQEAGRVHRPLPARAPVGRAAIAAGRSRRTGPKYLRWALIEAATHAARHPRYKERYERTKRRLGRQRGAKVAASTSPASSPTAIWHVLTKNEPFAPAGPAHRSGRLTTPVWNWAAGSLPPDLVLPPRRP